MTSTTSTTYADQPVTAPVRHAQRQRTAWQDHADEVTPRIPRWVRGDSPVRWLARQR